MSLNKKVIFFVLLVILSANAINATDNNITSNVSCSINEDSFLEKGFDNVDNNNLELNFNELQNNEINLNQTDSENVHLESDYNSNDNSGNYSFLSDDIVMYFKNGTKYQVKLIDNFDNPIPNYIVNLTINGNTYQKITDNNGIVSLNINLSPGVYEIVAENKDLGIQTYDFIKILPTIKGHDIVKYFKNATQYHVTLVDGQGNFLAKKDILMNINGVFYHKTTDDSGKAKLSINLSPGEYIITITDPIMDF